MKKIFIDTLTLMLLSDDELCAKVEAAGFDMKRPIKTECEFGGNWYIQEELKEQKIMNLKDFLNLQGGLDNVIMQRVSESGRKLTDDELLSCRLLALYTETGEFCNELGAWKYWKQSHKEDKEKSLSEFVDMLFFVFSIANLKGYTAEQIQEAYMKKWNENIRRQKENY